MSIVQAVLIAASLMVGNYLFAFVTGSSSAEAFTRTYFQSWAVLACWLISRT